MRRISFVFGTRPEAIKLGPVILAMRRQSRFIAHVCVTAQHRELLDQMLSVFDLSPDVDLDLMQQDQSLFGLTANVVSAVGGYLQSYQPELVVVQGDTTTTFCAALAAFYNQIPVAHVEAGLRTWDKLSPYPEEINRTLTTRLADYHFAPTESAKANLVREGVSADRIFVTGNTVIDALHIALNKIDCQTPIPGLPPQLLNGQSSSPLVLITSHRRENFGEGFQSICEAIRSLAREFAQTAFVYPVHLNPNVRRPVLELLSGIENVFLLEPLGYLNFVALLSRAKFILTDSGGIQEEAPTLRKPVLLMRNTTERPEAVEAGTARLVGTEVSEIVNEARRLLLDNDFPRDLGPTPNPFGDGTASHRILQIIASELDRASNA